MSQKNKVESLILALRRQEQADLCKSQAKLVYIVSFRPARATQRVSGGKKISVHVCSRARECVSRVLDLQRKVNDSVDLMMSQKSYTKYHYEAYYV